MILFILTFLLGDMYLQTFANLPSLSLAVLITIFTLIIWRIFRYKLLFLIFAFTFGFTFTLYHAYNITSWVLQKNWEKKPLIATGIISSLPQPGKFGTSFEFALQSLSNHHAIEYPHTKIRLTWNHEALHVGDKWRLHVKLKRMHSTQSPGAFDYEAWSLQRGLRATGNVIDKEKNKLLAHQHWLYPLQTIRQLLQQNIQHYLPQTPTSPWLMALMTGERNGIAPEDWQVLRNTGTNHLMAIGGLHIGLAAGFMHFIVSFLWRRAGSLSLIFPAQKAGLCAALITAFIYSSLSGFLLPSQRAIIMLCIFIMTTLAYRKINPWNVWSLALLIVLLINPATVLSESFWLSFGTIALILYGMHHRLSPSGLWWKYMRVQWVIGIGLIPLTFALFGECSLISFVANTIAIPWLAVSILPLCLVSIVFIFIFPTVASGLLWMADGSLALLWSVLSTLAQTSWSSLHIYIPDIYYLLGMMVGVVLLLLPAGMPLRILGVIGFLPVFLHQGDKPARNEYWLNLLDVGQGLSVVVQTANHILVYDAGAKVTASSDMGERIVLPYLRSMGAKKIDLMVISHADNDHIGGAKSILQNYPGTLIKTSVPEKFNKAHYCQYGDSWQWDGVKFTFLYPSQHEKNLRNDSSCVLQIDNGKYKTLLTGDIEKFAEHELVNNIPDQLAADILVAPHHGSKTSAVPAFVAAVHPQMVLYATGYLNRYHFPHAKVVQAYEAIHALAFNTVDTGSVRFKVSNDVMPDAYRVKGRRYWMD